MERTTRRGKYALDAKIAKYLSDHHGIATIVSGLAVTVGAYSETLSGTITRAKLDQLAARIRSAK